MMINKDLQLIMYAIVFIAGVWIGKISFFGNSSLSDYNESSQKINKIIQLIQDKYVDEIDHLDFEQQIINTFLTQLDPHTTYSSKEDQEYLDAQLNGSFSGVGIEFNILNDTLVVITPISGGPSEKLGITSGDKIVEVDGENIASIGLTNSDVIKNFRGDKGTEVYVKIFRKGSKGLLEYRIIRGDIPINSVDASIMLDDNIGYIKLNSFSFTTNNEFDIATNNLLKKG